MPATSNDRFAVLVPVKPPAFAKSRLGDLGDDARRDLATAFAVDTVTAAVACSVVGRVLVVTDDHVLARGLAELGVDVIPDGTSGDLNGTLVLAAAEMHRRDPGLRLAALCADLPALRPEELERALAEPPDEAMTFVADADGVGTTLVAAPGLATFRPRFGPSSRQRHLDAGAHEVGRPDLPSVRRDVDDRDDLVEAIRLGVGSRTSLVTTMLGLSWPRVAPVQGTVSAFDADTENGRVLLDDGVEVPVAADALAGSRLRLLRPGQRVRLETTGAGGSLRIVGLQILTLS